MGNEADNKFTWITSLKSPYIFSDHFVIGGCRWFLIAFPNGSKIVNYLSLYLVVADYKSLPNGWSRHVNVSYTIVNKSSKELSQLRETQDWFDEKELAWGFIKMISLTELLAKDSGFLVNGHLKIVVAINILKVVGKLDVLEESEEATRPLKKIKLVDCAKSKDLPSTAIETIDVNGFHVLPSQVKSVNHLFERHPNIATKLRIKNQYLKTGYMNALVNLSETLSQSPKKITKDDLADAYSTMESMTGAGFELDWLKKKLDQVSENKQKVEAGEIRMQELKDLKQKCSYLEAQLDKEKKGVLAASAPLSDGFSDLGHLKFD